MNWDVTVSQRWSSDMTITMLGGTDAASAVRRGTDATIPISDDMNKTSAIGFFVGVSFR